MRESIMKVEILKDSGKKNGFLKVQQNGRERKAKIIRLKTSGEKNGMRKN